MVPTYWQIQTILCELATKKYYLYSSALSIWRLLVLSPLSGYAPAWHICFCLLYKKRENLNNDASNNNLT